MNHCNIFESALFFLFPGVVPQEGPQPKENPDIQQAALLGAWSMLPPIRHLPHSLSYNQFKASQMPLVIFQCDLYITQQKESRNAAKVHRVGWKSPGRTETRTMALDCTLSRARGTQLKSQEPPICTPTAAQTGFLDFIGNYGEIHHY